MYHQCTNQNCQHEYPTRPIQCVVCGHPETIPIPELRRGQVYGSEEYRTYPPQLEPLKSFQQLEDATRTRKYAFGGFEDLLMPLNARITIEGLPGSGKSTLARRIAISLAAKEIPVLLLSTEEGLETEVFQKGMKRACSLLNIERIPSSLKMAYIDSAGSWKEYEARWNERGIVIVDSLSLLKVNFRWLEHHLKTSKNGYVFVEHLTTARQPKGGYTVSYLVDTRIITMNIKGTTMARIAKNRFGQYAEFDIHAPTAHRTENPKIIQFPTQEAE